MISRYQMSPVYWLHANPVSALWYAAKKAIATGLDAFIDSLSFIPNIDRGAIEAIATAILIVILAVSAGALIFGLWKWYQFRHKQQKSRSIFGHEIDRDSDFTSFLLKGESYALAGDYQEAIRAEFVGLLLALEEKCHIHVLEWWTTTEIGEGLEVLGFNHVPQYRQIAMLFNCWWYGPTPDQEAYRAWREQLMILWREVT